MKSIANCKLQIANCKLSRPAVQRVRFDGTGYELTPFALQRRCILQIVAGHGTPVVQQFTICNLFKSPQQWNVTTLV
jgi:hypothetical protein